MSQQKFNPEDLIGKQFGKLTVKSYLGKRPSGSRQRHFYQCLCQCGNETESERHKLLSGRKKSCGHCRQITTSLNYFPAPETIKPDMIGRRFGRLVVTSYEGRRDQGYYSPELYRCKCDCGKEITVSKASLLSGSVKSCGCIRKERKRG